MQLNKTHKQNIVDAIMEDVPRIDYETKITDYVQGEAVRLMPPEIRALYDNLSTRAFLACVTIQTNWAHCSFSRSIFWCRKGVFPSAYGTTLYLTRPAWNDDADDLTTKLLDTVRPEVVSLAAKAEKQFKDRDSMKDRLDTVFKGIRTLKQAKTLLEPELHKYLPAEQPKDPDQKAAQASTALVPYVVASLRELGWPKDQEPKAEEVV